MLNMEEAWNVMEIPGIETIDICLNLVLDWPLRGFTS